MDKQLKLSYFVSANEANAQQELAVHILVGNIIDIATAHANSLNIGNPDMADINGGWVLSRLTVEMSRWPAVNEHYSLTTWIESYNHRFSERAFSIIDDHGETIGYARTVWMIIDTVTHRGLTLDHLSLSQEMVDGTSAPIERQTRHFPILPAEMAEGRRNCVVADREPAKYTFRYCDIDFYRHVNTVRYIVLLLNQFTLEDMDANRVSRFEISFMREASYGMTIDIMRRDEPDHGTLFTLCPQGEFASPLLFSRIFMKPRK